MLLAVDLGIRSGLACFDATGRLHWYRSTNFGDASRLRRAIPGIFDSIPRLKYLVLEGGGPLFELWCRQGRKRGVQVLQLQAEDWRRELLLARERRSARLAKARAAELAREIIRSSGAPLPRGTLVHDVAEAVLVGLYASRHLRREGADGLS
ncbi:MAG: hypothetical protein D6751_12950 [Deltaproteobacteria bacterium]|nr:MAG: hypothetical protein D6751_12950 [Deltaproteobacteria bacterium]